MHENERGDTRAEHGGWDDGLLHLFDDLEQQAAGLHLAEREGEVADVAASEYAAVDLEARLRGALGDGSREIALRLRGGQQPRGRLTRVGAGWCVLAAGPTRWLVVLPAVLVVTGAAPRAAHPSTRSVADTLPLRSLLRRLADDLATGPVAVHLGDGERLEGRVVRVGADFVELAPGSSREAGLLVPVAAIDAVRWTR
ncbi:hypothetical protein [Nocardioides marmoraquaticus]